MEDNSSNTEGKMLRRYILAPLVGGSDLSFRLLARKYGAQVTYTEMCMSEYWLAEKKYEKRLVYEFDPRDRPLFLQLAGNSAKPIIEMANNPLFKDKIDGVDLNVGCPQGFALEKGCGCYLLKDPDHLVSMCEEIVKNIPYPLSVKLRLHESVQYTINVMKRLYDVGVKDFAVHGRYFWQKGNKRGLADWNAIKQIRKSLPGVHLVGNGNIGKYEDFERMIEETQVDGAMAGYGALCNPAIFSATPIPLSIQIRDYLMIARVHYNKWIDILRHMHWILKTRLQGKPEMMEKLFECKNLSDLCAFIKMVDSSLEVTLPPLEPFEKDKIEYPKQKKKGQKDNKN